MQERSGWLMAAPAPVGDAATLLARLRALAQGGAVAFGVDFPLGLPMAYVRLHPPEAADFPGFLQGLTGQEALFTPAATLAEICPDRPFYPARGRAGMTRAAHAAALGLPSAAALSRACDRATAERPAGAPLFWTLGANQVGKGALHAWRHLLIPALQTPRPPLLWPFAGRFRALLQPGEVAVAETYPAEALRQLGFRLRGSKRRQADRLALAAPLLAAMAALGATAEAALGLAIAEGFGSDAAAEDRFDCVLGLLCVLNVLAGRRPDAAPPCRDIQLWEGWVLGQHAATAHPDALSG